MIGLSTGSLFTIPDLKKIVNIINDLDNITCLEISSLRENNLDYVLEMIDKLDLCKYKYISFHIPSKLNYITEDELIKKLEYIYLKEWYMILHPDIIIDYNKWTNFRDKLLIENMDSRKRIGSDENSLKQIFTKLPEANLCFDIAHSMDMDPLGFEGEFILSSYVDKLKQIHISGILNSVHCEITEHLLNEYLDILVNSNLDTIESVPFIIESPLNRYIINSEIKKVERLIESTLDKLNAIQIKKSISIIKDG